MQTFLHKLLDSPSIYTLAQSVLAPGAEKRIAQKLTALAERVPNSARLLDLGCGPCSWLWKLGWQPVGLDLSHQYSRVFIEKGRSAVTGSCCALPFADNSFDGVWTIGVLHHLSDQEVRKTVSEMLRVCRSDGYVVVMDAVMPPSAWKKPLPYVIRKLDRGIHMRTQEQLESLLPASIPKSIKRYTYSLTGLEMLECVWRSASRGS